MKVLKELSVSWRGQIYPFYERYSWDDGDIVTVYLYLLGIEILIDLRNVKVKKGKKA